MTEANRLYDGRLNQVSLHVYVINALRQQILCTVDNMYLMELEHPELGYLVSPRDMLLHHQQATYGTITPLENGQNRATLTSSWNPNDDMERLWLHIRDAQLLAHQANEEILDPAAIRLTVQALEASAVFNFALDNWRLKDDATKTILSFKEHINKEDSECNRKLTAETGAYHGAHGADGNHPRGTPPPNPAPTSGHIILPNGVIMYYCWSTV
jgi:hypothetical protein